MQTVAQARIIRDLDESLALYAEDTALHILPDDESAVGDVNNPLAQLLKPEQVALYDVKAFPIKQEKFDAVYDPLHERLKASIEDGELEAALRLAKSVSEAPDGCRTRAEMSLQKRAYSFFTLRGKKVTASEVGRFIAGLPAETLAKYLEKSAERIDALKAETLARKVLGTLKDGKQPAIHRLRAELGLVAVTSIAGKVARKSKKSEAADCASLSFDMEKIKKGHAFTGHVLATGISVPAFAFQTDPCKSGRDNHASIPLEERFKKIEAKKALSKRVEQAKAKKGKQNSDDGAALSEDVVDPCECDCDEAPCLPVDPCCVDIKYYLSDLLELREETHCYEAGDMAYIENIAPRELRKRSHTFRKVIEDYSEEETTESRSEERDHQVTDRNQVSTEVNKQMKASLDVEAKVTGGTYTINSNAHLSREVAQREARENFREMVSKAVMKIQTETRKLTSRRVTTDSTETNLHKFNNSGSDLPQVAKYFYVNQVKKGQVFSHGLRLMLDILIPSPGSLFLELEERKSKQASGLEEPKRPNLVPSDFDPEVFPGYEGQNSYRELWEYLMETFEISDFPEPPPDMMPPRAPYTTGKLYHDNPASVTVPEGYRALRLEVHSAHVKDDIWDTAPARDVAMSIYFGNSTVEKNLNDVVTGPLSIGLNGPRTLNLKAVGWHVHKGDSWIRGTIHFEPIQYDYETWQEDAYATIMAKYEADMVEYERLLAEHKMRFREERKLMHPFTAEEHIRTQMKQASIFMMCDDFGDEVMNMNTEPCGYPTVFREKAREATSRWYFFDRAFDWNQAEFIFYDYFRNPICQWHERYDPDEPNFMLKAFKRAGYARAQIPCSPGMEDDVLKYLQTGEFWNGDDFDVIDSSDPRYLAVATELKHSYSCHQNDRPGNVHVTANDTNIEIHCSEFYLTAGTTGATGVPDDDLINLDLDREIFISGVPYRIVSIEPKYVPTDADFDPDCWTWVVTLERRYEGATSANLKHAVGAKYIGDNFFFKLPTEMVWLGDMFKDDGTPNTCLPCYPVEC